MDTTGLPNRSNLAGAYFGAALGLSGWMPTCGIELCYYGAPLQGVLVAVVFFAVTAAYLWFWFRKIPAGRPGARMAFVSVTFVVVLMTIAGALVSIICGTCPTLPDGFQSAINWVLFLPALGWLLLLAINPWLRSGARAQSPSA